MAHVTIRRLKEEVFMNTRNQYTKEENFLVAHVTIRRPQVEVFMNTRSQYMKEGNFPVAHVTTRLLKRRLNYTPEVSS